MRTILLSLMIIAAGCGNKKDKANDEAAKAQVNADDKAVAAAKAQKEADDKMAAAKQQADAADAKALGDARDSGQKAFDAADRKLVSFKEKVVKATGKKRKNADAAAAEADTRETAAKASLAKLNAAAVADLTAAKTQLDADIAALNTSIDAVEKAVK
jgi:colicin import membrane protein